MNHPQIPKRIGRYDIISEIGRGGMGIVYAAHDSAFERSVALKVLPHERLTDDVMRARFLREARMIAALEHEAIVPVYDYGEEDGRPYLVMRLMPSGSLSERMRNGPLSVEEAISYVDRLAPALDAAHQRSIIHRDLKPANILFDSNGLPYLSDFGIAKLGAGGETSASQLLGTPAYMSPEQVSGTEGLDGRSDQYALAVLLWEMLTGALPFQAETPIQLALRHLNDPAPLLRDVRPDLPKGLEGILSRAMAKQAKDRFPTASAFARALRAVVPAPALQSPVTPISGGIERPSVALSRRVKSLSLPRLSAPSLSGISFSNRLPSRRAAVPLLLGTGAALLLGVLALGVLFRLKDAPPSDSATAVVMIMSPTARAEATPTTGVELSPTGGRIALPTTASEEGMVTSTPMPALPTSTPQPTATPLPTRPPFAFTRLLPTGGARVVGRLNVEAAMSGLPSTARAEVWMGGDPLYRVTTMGRDGGAFYSTINAPPNGNYGNWRWQVLVYNGDSLLMRSEVRSIFWMNPAPAPTAPPAPAPTAPPVTPPPVVSPAPTIPPTPVP